MLESLFNNVACLRPSGPATFIKKTPVQVFSCEFCEIFKNTYFVENLRAAVPEDTGQVIIVSEDDMEIK